MDDDEFVIFNIDKKTRHDLQVIWGVILGLDFYVTENLLAKYVKN